MGDREAHFAGAVSLREGPAGRSGLVSLALASGAGTAETEREEKRCSHAPHYER
jgi:hypothetical protein